VEDTRSQRLRLVYASSYFVSAAFRNKHAIVGLEAQIARFRPSGFVHRAIPCRCFNPPVEFDYKKEKAPRQFSVRQLRILQWLRGET